MVVQDLLEPNDSLLRLDKHLAHIDEGQVLVPPAPKLAMRDVPGMLKRIDVRLCEEPAHGDCHQIKRGSRGDSEARGHAFRVANPAYESVAANLGNLSPRYRVLSHLTARMIDRMDKVGGDPDLKPDAPRVVPLMTSAD